ncbi:MAG: hypothetical protein A3B89_00115 [Candidatus Buchananbacteria bacterium RIFCSPHIGHO2_02_FULL_40_13]|uniref:Glycosyltransferase 2-like domain-containing protein n=1 Tax=Candidatus Buchananbacteria bacterium RIFCSPLOWO2_01_FULL_39_33 TaxID=1797543 RepID=A0A1G1YM30_9BACT|nr:MAG: hypothetical protein A3B89_00115 [Candidatus Buchananbacteria bacterium RIFCSPHIGHO2_02_FULL_40_13]OGY52507.1 MAG: hypothetical protein A3A02_01580 [Candidatus Buchananbacteria bacterium RIFCSPLOWO2_01_FULL_39_33]
MKILVLIPAYNEESTIGEVIRDVRTLGFDILVVDDGSNDKTAELAKNNGAVVLSHQINRGQGAAISTGIAYAQNKNYEIMVFFDADGQMKAAEIKNLLQPILSAGYEAVLGSRFLGRAENIPLAKLLTLKLALLFTKFTTDLKLTDSHNGFQAWKLSTLAKINLTQDRQAYASELLEEIAANKIKYQEVPVTIAYTVYSRRKGQSVFNAFNILWDLIIKR